MPSICPICTGSKNPNQIVCSECYEPTPYVPREESDEDAEREFIVLCQCDPDKGAHWQCEEVTS
jgi:hypothetical protein